MEEELPVPHRILLGWEKRVAKQKDLILSALYVEKTAPPIEKIPKYDKLLRDILPPGVKFEIREKEGQDILANTAASYNTLTKTITLYKDASLTPVNRAILEHEIRHWEQDEEGKGRPTQPTLEHEVDAQLHILKKLMASPKRNLPVLLFLFGEEFPKIYQRS